MEQNTIKERMRKKIRKKRQEGMHRKYEEKNNDNNVRDRGGNTKIESSRLRSRRDEDSFKL